MWTGICFCIYLLYPLDLIHTDAMKRWTVGYLARCQPTHRASTGTYIIATAQFWRKTRFRAPSVLTTSASPGWLSFWLVSFSASSVLKSFYFFLDYKLEDFPCHTINFHNEIWFSMFGIIWLLWWHFTTYKQTFYCRLSASKDGQTSCTTSKTHTHFITGFILSYLLLLVFS